MSSSRRHGSKGNGCGLTGSDVDEAPMSLIRRSRCSTTMLVSPDFGCCMSAFQMLQTHASFAANIRVISRTISKPLLQIFSWSATYFILPCCIQLFIFSQDFGAMDGDLL